MIHIAAATQIRLDTDRQAYYRRKLSAGKTRAEAMRCLKRRISEAIYRQLIADARATRCPTLRIRDVIDPAVSSAFLVRRTGNSR